MILLETDKLERAAKVFKHYWQEVVIVALVYSNVFIFKLYESSKQTIENNLRNEIIRVESERDFYKEMDFGLLKMKDSIMQKREEDGNN